MRTLRRDGFTLVELLIVIVVIAILAAISIVAYNGIQTRAIESSIDSDLASAAKKFELYNAEHGRYPSTVTEAKSLDVKFSQSPITNNNLLCANNTGYALYLRDPRHPNFVGRIQTDGNVEHLDSSAYGSATPMCEATPFPTMAWGTYWVTGG